ncbi:MAG: hypothetical protein R2705_11005 [Ilumatobacteraceae bacterium]
MLAMITASIVALGAAIGVRRDHHRELCADRPVRVLDTRIGLGGVRLGANGEVTVKVVTAAVASAAGVDAASVTAVVLNVTAVDSAKAGFVTIYPANESRPDTSVINPEFAGHTIANTVTARVSPDGSVKLFDFGGGDLLVDVQGVYVSAATATAGAVRLDDPDPCARHPPLVGIRGQRDQDRRSAHRRRSERCHRSGDQPDPPPAPRGAGTSRCGPARAAHRTRPTSTW